MKINNVVDDFFFDESKLPKRSSNTKRILNITCFDEPHKNVKMLLRAAKKISEKRRDWLLVLVGTGVDYQEVREYAESLQIPDGLLEWTGELPPRKVSEEFDKADIFVLTSNYENAPVVIAESVVKGVPVISTRVGGIHEMIYEKSGILIKPNREDELIAALEKMLNHYQEYNRDIIRADGQQYSYEAVGKKLKDIYEEVQH